MKLKKYYEKDKFKLIIYAVLAFLVCYMLPNHIGFVEPSFLKLFDFEINIPFVDWTIWVYMSDYVYIVLAFLLLKDLKNINRMYYTIIHYICK